MSLRILIAPSGFKESLEVDEVANCIEAGILRVFPSAQIHKAPLVDGGEGFSKALVAATGGTLHELTVTGPVGQPVKFHFGFLGGTDVKQRCWKWRRRLGCVWFPAMFAIRL